MSLGLRLDLRLDLGGLDLLGLESRVPIASAATTGTDALRWRPFDLLGLDLIGASASCPPAGLDAPLVKGRALLGVSQAWVVAGVSWTSMGSMAQTEVPRVSSPPAVEGRALAGAADEGRLAGGSVGDMPAAMPWGKPPRWSLHRGVGAYEDEARGS